MPRTLASITQVASVSAVLFTFSYLSFADQITLSTSGVSSTALGASADTLTLNAGSGTYDTDSGLLNFQVGDFNVGDSEIPDQVINFSVDELLTVDGASQDFTLYGQDNVTSSSDTLTIFGGTPIILGGETFTLQSFSISEGNLGDYPITLQASVEATQTPEPSSILLIGTGLIGVWLITDRVFRFSKA